MGYISFNPSQRLIRVPIKVEDINGSNYRDLVVALDTGSSNTSIPTRIAADLGYDLSNPKQVVLLTTSSNIVPAKLITVRKLTAIGESVENIDVVCHDLPFGSTIEGVLGLNFLSHFDLNISFSTGTIELHSY